MLASFGSSIPGYQLPQAQPCLPTASNLTARLTVLYSSRQFYSLGGSGVSRYVSAEIEFVLRHFGRIAETRPKPCLGQFRRRNRNRNRISVGL